MIWERAGACQFYIINSESDYKRFVNAYNVFIKHAVLAKSLNEHMDKSF